MLTFKGIWVKELQDTQLQMVYEHATVAVCNATAQREKEQLRTVYGMLPFPDHPAQVKSQGRETVQEQH